MIGQFIVSISDLGKHIYLSASSLTKNMVPRSYILPVDLATVLHYRAYLSRMAFQNCSCSLQKLTHALQLMKTV